MKIRPRIVLNSVLLVLLIYELGFRVHRSLWDHAVGGCTALTLVLIHLYLNRRFFTGLTRGRFTSVRALYAISSLLLSAAFITLLVSSVQVSGMVFEISPFAFSHQARQLHVFSASWLFVLMIWHAGLHAERWWSKAERQLACRKKSYLQRFYLLQAVLTLFYAFLLAQSPLLPGLLLQPVLAQPYAGTLDYCLQTFGASCCLLISAHWALVLARRL